MFYVFYFSRNNKNFFEAKNSIGEFASISSVMFGVFICIASCMVSFIIFMIAKRRNVLAFTAQQTMPVAEEVMETMAPKVGNLAKEVAKGIKEGLSDDEQK